MLFCGDFDIFIGDDIDELYIELEVECMKESVDLLL